jgi:hypothetical protein
MLVKGYACERMFVNRLTAGVAIECKVVLSTRGHARDLVLERKRLNAVGKICRRLLALVRKEVGSKTSNMW